MVWRPGMLAPRSSAGNKATGITHLVNPQCTVSVGTDYSVPIQPCVLPPMDVGGEVEVETTGEEEDVQGGGVARHRGAVTALQEGYGEDKDVSFQGVINMTRMRMTEGGSATATQRIRTGSP